MQKFILCIMHFQTGTFKKILQTKANVLLASYSRHMLIQFYLVVFPHLFIVVQPMWNFVVKVIQNCSSISTALSLE